MTARLAGLQVPDGIGERILPLCQSFEVKGEIADGAMLVCLDWPGDHATEATPLVQPPDRDRLSRAVVGDEDSIVRGRAREEDLVLGLLGIKIDCPCDVPGSVPKSLDEMFVDAGIREDGEAPGHYRPGLPFRYSALVRWDSASQERSSSKEASISAGCS